MTAMAHDSFYDDLAGFSVFAQVLDPARYRPLPGGWLIGLADVVDSTGAIAAGRYKAVNMVGASVIAAVRNVLGEASLAFAFGGDGASFAIPASARAAVEPALAAVRTWAAEEIGLDLRAALVPIEAIRAAGHDVLVARYEPTPHVAYAMFAGGGLAWADGRMKAGEWMLAPAPPGSRPRLDGLSCEGRFASLIGEVLAVLSRAAGGSRPLPEEGPEFALSPAGLELEVKARPGTLAAWRGRLRAWSAALLGVVLARTGWRVGGFDLARYRVQTAANTDFRKFDDGLKVTADCTPETVSELEALLRRARAGGLARYGLHRQDSALMTCIVPSPVRDDHVHFLDGAGGGYAMAALMLKAQIAEDAQPAASART